MLKQNNTPALLAWGVILSPIKMKPRAYFKMPFLVRPFNIRF